MAERRKGPSEEARDEREPYVPASPVKRIMAWVGVAYMLILVLLNVYPFFNGGVNLHGLGPLLVCPGAAGLAVITRYQARRSTGGRRIALSLLCVACAAVFLLGLSDGIPALMAGLGGGA